MPEDLLGALVEEATRRSGVVWLRVPGRPDQVVWHAWHEGAAHVVHGGLEQPLDGVEDGDRVLVVVRSRERQADRLVQWWARVAQVLPGTDAWDAVVPPLRARRLHAPDGPQAPQRWARESVVLSLVPDGTYEPVDRG